MKSIYYFLVWGAVCLLCVPGLCHAEPKLVMPHRSFTFEPVPDGTVITHDYTVKNQGDEPLEILEIGTT